MQSKAACGCRRAACKLPSARRSGGGQIAALNQERDAVRQRVEKMLQQMDELL
jgi:hypothetical protein